MANEDELLDEEVRRIREQLKEVKRRKKERYAAVLRERNSQGTSRDKYDNSYYSEDSEAEPGSAEALAKGMMAVQDRAMFNLRTLAEKYSEKDKQRKPSDMIEFGSGGQVYYPDNMPANQQQMHIDKIFRDDLNFGKGALCAPHNSKEVFRGDSRAWRESVKRDEMYREHKRQQKHSFLRPVFKDEDAFYRQMQVKNDRRRSKVKNEEYDVDTSDEDLSDEEFSDGNTSDDMSSEIFSSSEEDEEEEQDEKEEDKVRVKLPDSSVMNNAKTTPLRSKKSGSSASVKKEPPESRTSKELTSRTPNSPKETEILETPLSEKKTGNQYNSKNCETLQKNTPEFKISQKRKREEPEVLSSTVTKKITPKIQKIDSPQLKRVSPRTIEQEASARPSKSLKIEISETPTTRNRSRNIKTGISECSESASTVMENEAKLSTSITTQPDIQVSRVKPEIIKSALETTKDSHKTTELSCSKQNNSENTHASANRTAKTLGAPVSKSASTQPCKSIKASDTNRDIELPTTSKQSEIMCKSETSPEEQDIVVIESVEGTSVRRNPTRNRKRTLDQHWNARPVKKTPKVDFETKSSSSLEVEFESEGEKPSRRKSNRKSGAISTPVEERIWGQVGNRLF